MEDSGRSSGSSDSKRRSRKRSHDNDSDDDSVSKRSNRTPDKGEGTYHLKILIPSLAAGAIIGKGGETIAQLQKDTNAQVKMSKGNDFYPGTRERVCLISGSVDSILTVLSFIMDKIQEKHDHNAEKNRPPQVIILVPNSTVGMIIGKGGSYIKQIKEESGAYVQISQKAEDKSLSERCITVISDEVEHSKTAITMILDKIVDDPQSGTFLNVSYAHMTGPVASSNPTGSPFANSPHSHTPQSGNYRAGLSRGGVNLSLNLYAGCPNGGAGNPVVTGQVLENVRNILRSSGFSHHSNAEVCQAINTLMNYGIVCHSL